MKIFLALLMAASALLTTDAKAQEADGPESRTAIIRQVIDYLTEKHVSYDVVYDARDFGLPAPDSLRLTTSDGYDIFAYEVCPERPKAVVVCLAGIENPSVTAFYGDAA